MLIPSASVTSSDDEALRGLLLSSLTALMKASKTNSISPLTFLFRERLQNKQQRRELNRALFAITTAIARKKVGGAKDNVQKAAVYDSVVKSVANEQPSLKAIELMINKLQYTEEDLVMIEEIAMQILVNVDRQKTIIRGY